MPILKPFKTSAELFTYLTTDFKKSGPILMEKVNDKYQGISTEEFKSAIVEAGNGLSSLGVGDGDKIAIISENRPEWVYADMGILGLGGVDVPLYPILTSDSIEYILNDSKSIGIFVSNQFQLNKVVKIWNKCKTLKFIIVMSEIDTASHNNVYTLSALRGMGRELVYQKGDTFSSTLPNVKPDQLCTLIYTAGTTGEPKGVMLTHWNIFSNVQAAHQIFNMTQEDLFLSFLPLSHVFERMAGYYTALACGATIAYAEGIEKIAANLAEVRPTVMTAVPRLFERMYSKIKRNVEKSPEKKQKIFNWAVSLGREVAALKKSSESIPISLNLKHKLADKLVYQKLKAATGGRLRFFISGGAALARELGEFFEAVGIKVIEGYGLTESSPVISANRLNDYKFGTVGKPLPGVEVKIAKDGEILAYGPNIMQGYYNRKKETEETIKDGWLHTGDIGVFDADGFLIITDRKKHLFKTSGGKYVAPAPIENMFLGSRYIEQFVLIGDRRMFLSALIVPDFEALKEYADAHRISYNNPEELTKLKQIYELLEKDLAQFQKKLANFERVRKFTILDRPFSIETGELTPKLSVKRKVIEERYRDLIEDMYKGLEEKA